MDSDGTHREVDMEEPLSPAPTPPTSPPASESGTFPDPTPDSRIERAKEGSEGHRKKEKEQTNKHSGHHRQRSSESMTRSTPESKSPTTAVRFMIKRRHSQVEDGEGTLKSKPNVLAAPAASKQLKSKNINPNLVALGTRSSTSTPKASPVLSNIHVDAVQPGSDATFRSWGAKLNIKPKPSPKDTKLKLPNPNKTSWSDKPTRLPPLPDRASHGTPPSIRDPRFTTYNARANNADPRISSSARKAHTPSDRMPATPIPTPAKLPTLSDPGLRIRGMAELSPVSKYHPAIQQVSQISFQSLFSRPKLQSTRQRSLAGSSPRMIIPKYTPPRLSHSQAHSSSSNRLNAMHPIPLPPHLHPPPHPRPPPRNEAPRERTSQSSG